jgi:uncharacterized protein (DUF305 family)
MSMCRILTPNRIVVGFGLVALSTACRTAAPSVLPAGDVRPQGDTSITPAERARSDIEHPQYTAAGVQFMSGMIAHHAQAIVMADWAPSHAASPAVRALCDRISVSQTDEITFMESWLRDRHQAIPPADPRGYTMPGTDTPMLMPGMLTAAQMTELDQARGEHFDHLLLSDMIMHHRGALDMVHQLTASGQEQDGALAMYATNVAADQSAEINRMLRMITALPSDTAATQHPVGPAPRPPLSPTQPPARP